MASPFKQYKAVHCVEAKITVLSTTIFPYFHNAFHKAVFRSLHSTYLTLSLRYQVFRNNALEKQY